MDLFAFCHFRQKYIHNVGKKKLSLRREQQFALVVHYKRLQGVVHIELVAQGRKSIELGQTR